MIELEKDDDMEKILDRETLVLLALLTLAVF